MDLVVFFCGDHSQVVFAPNSLCVWINMPWRNRRIRVLPRNFLHELIL